MKITFSALMLAFWSVFLLFFTQSTFGAKSFADATAHSTTEAPDDATADDDPSLHPNSLTVQLTTKGLQVASRGMQLAAQAMMRHMSIEDFHKDNGTVEEVQSMNYEAPDITAAFKANEGIHVGMSIPKFDTSAKYNVKGVPELKSMPAKIEGLVTNVLLKIKPGAQHQPLMDVSNCTVKIDKITPLPQLEPVGLKAKAIHFAKNALGKRLNDAVCKAARVSSTFVNAGFLNMGHKIPDLSDAILPSSVGRGARGRKKFDLNVLCGYAHTPSGAADKGHISGYLTTFLANATKQIGDADFVTKMVESPIFTDQQMVMRVGAGFVKKSAEKAKFWSARARRPMSAVAGPSAVDSGRLLGVSRTDKDACLGINEQPINSFLKLAHHKNLFKHSSNLTDEIMSPQIQALIKKLLKQSDLRLILNAETESAPTIKFLPTASMVNVKLLVRIGAKSLLKDERLVEASVDTNVLTHTYIENHYVKSNISLGPSPKIVLKNVMPGFLEIHANELISKTLRGKIWPAIEKKHNQMLGHGVKLPSPCGLSFLDPKIVYTDGQLKVCSDLKFDSDAMLKRIEKWQKEQKKH